MKHIFTYILIIFSGATFAQSGFSTMGNVKIHNEFTGSGLFICNTYVINGVVFTEETTNPNKIIFGVNSHWKQKSKSSFIDGFVRTNVEENFLFPIGNIGKYKPLGLTVSKNAVASYKKRKPMNETWIDSTKIKVISPQEYWDVSSVNEAKITLVYDEEISGLKEIDEEAVNKLTIVAFDGYKWIRIPSIIDEYMIDVTSDRIKSSMDQSSVIKGSITSTVDVPLIYFSSFTLGLTQTPTEFDKKKIVEKLVENKSKITQTKNPIQTKNGTAKTEVVFQKNVPSPSEKITISEDLSKQYVLIKKIHFPFDEKELSKYSTGILNILCENDLLKREKSFRIKLVGHTDIFGSNNYNYILGLRRAETIKQFLFSKGITNVEIDVSSEGEKNANVDCQECKSSEMVNLRRVDIYILEK